MMSDEERKSRLLMRVRYRHVVEFSPSEEIKKQTKETALIDLGLIVVSDSLLARDFFPLHQLGLLLRQ